MNADLVVSHANRVDHVSVQGGVLLYDGAVLRLLAGSGAWIWASIDGVSTAAELADRLAAAFVDDATSVRKDVRNFLAELATWGVVDVLSTTSEPGLTARADVGYVRDGSLGLLVDLRDGRRRALTSTGARIWELAVTLRSPSHIIEALQLEYSDAPASLANDVFGQIDQLVAEDFLLRVERRVTADLDHP